MAVNKQESSYAEVLLLLLSQLQANVKAYLTRKNYTSKLDFYRQHVCMCYRQRVCMCLCISLTVSWMDGWMDVGQTAVELSEARVLIS